MDPITAISLASNIISFIDFSTKLLRGAKNIHEAGSLEDNDRLEVVTRHMKMFMTKLLVPNPHNLIGADLELSQLAAKCMVLANDLLKLLEKIKAKDPKSRMQALCSAMRDMKYDEEKKSLEARLNSCRAQFEMQLNFLSR